MKIDNLEASRLFREYEAGLTLSLLELESLSDYISSLHEIQFQPNWIAQELFVKQLSEYKDRIYKTIQARYRL